MTDQPQSRRTRAPGERARARIVEQAAKLATVEGLEGLSIGRLASATGLPKSSVHALFGSKEQLQLATVSAARDSFITEVVAPALSAAGPGRPRLLALCEGYLSYVERRVFPGGCFFVAAAAEVGAQAGPLHDEVARIQQQWRDLLAAEARAAAGQRELPDGTDPAQLAFELGVILAGTDIIAVLHDDHHAVSRARTAIRTRLANRPCVSELPRESVTAALGCRLLRAGEAVGAGQGGRIGSSWSGACAARLPLAFGRVAFTEGKGAGDGQWACFVLP